MIDGIFATGATEGVAFHEAQLDPKVLERLHAQMRQRLFSMEMSDGQNSITIPGIDVVDDAGQGGKCILAGTKPWIEIEGIGRAFFKH